MSDAVINFSSTDLWLVNIAIAFMMFGVALGLTPDDFRRIVEIPRAPVAGLLTQFLGLPALTAAAVWLFDIPPELGLGMILLASCPGGTYSNVVTWLAGGSVGVSVTMTAVSSVAATILTPFNFAFWGGLNPATRSILADIAVNPFEVLAVVVVVLAVPIAAGMTVNELAPLWAERARRSAKGLTLALFTVVVALAFAKNFDLFLDTFDTVVPLVVAHNAAALGLGFVVASALHLSAPDRRAVTLEVGIQNSGLGLALAFTFMPGLGDAILVLAMWGVWHLVAGLVLALVWSRQREPALL